MLLETTEFTQLINQRKVLCEQVFGTLIMIPKIMNSAFSNIFRRSSPLSSQQIKENNEGEFRNPAVIIKATSSRRFILDLRSTQLCQTKLIVIEFLVLSLG
jgi:hypothetical protein